MAEPHIRILIVDDEPLARQFIRHLLSAEPDAVVIGECGNGRDALSAIRAERPDLVFLDVQMPVLDGFGMLRELGSAELPEIVFTTAFAEYAVAAFEFHAIDYLLKPFDEERFRAAFARARERVAAGRSQDGSEQLRELLKNTAEPERYPERFLVKVSGKLIFIRAAEVDAIRSDDKYVNIFVGEKAHLVRQSLAGILTQLDPAKFLQVHRSAIVNIDRIEHIESSSSGDHRIVLMNGMRIPVGRNYRDTTLDRLGTPL